MTRLQRQLKNESYFVSETFQFLKLHSTPGIRTLLVTRLLLFRIYLIVTTNFIMVVNGQRCSNFRVIFYVIISFWEAKIYTRKVAESVTKVIFCQNKVCINLCSFTIFQEN